MQRGLADRSPARRCVHGGQKKNRDGSFGIAIVSAQWGKGYGTEATRWTVDYCFEQLGLHRISLDVLAGNERALKLYKQM
jgi:RimJ/RimL family protein N-acetyltransferase